MAAKYCSHISFYRDQRLKMRSLLTILCNWLNLDNVALTKFKCTKPGIEQHVIDAWWKVVWQKAWKNTASFHFHKLKQNNTNMEPQAKKVMIFEAVQKKKHQLVKEKDTCSLWQPFLTFIPPLLPLHWSFNGILTTKLLSVTWLILLSIYSHTIVNFLVLFQHQFLAI